MTHHALIVFLFLGVSGCWPFVVSHSDVEKQGRDVAYVQGTWTGVTEPVTINDQSGKPHSVMALRIESGPSMKAADGSDYPMPADVKPVLVGENSRPLQSPDVRTGQRVEVAGMMVRKVAVYFGDDRTPETDPPSSEVFGIRVAGTPKVLPQ